MASPAKATFEFTLTQAPCPLALARSSGCGYLVLRRAAKLLLLLQSISSLKAALSRVLVESIAGRNISVLFYVSMGYVSLFQGRRVSRSALGAEARGENECACNLLFTSPFVSPCPFGRPRSSAVHVASCYVEYRDPFCDQSLKSGLLWTHLCLITH